MKGIHKTMIIVMFAAVMLIIVLIFFSAKIWPLIRWGPFSPCWGKFSSDMGTFSLIEYMRENQTVSIGDCVSAVMFVNKEVPEEYFEHVDPEYFGKLISACGIGGQSYIIGFPFEKYEVGWNVFKWPKKVWEEVKEFWKEDLGGIGPLCKIVDKEKRFVGNGVAIVTDGEYCVNIKQSEKNKDLLEIDIYEGSCEKGGNKIVGVPII